MKKYIRIGITILSFGISQTVLAQDNDPPPADSNIGIGTWGLGFGLGVEQYRDSFIDTASIQGDGESERIVTTEKSIDTRPSAWLTVNWNLKPFGSSRVNISGDNVISKKWGFFAGVKLLGESNDAFSAFALGPQVTFLTDKNREISVGLGWVTHPTRTYAGNIVEGESLPAQFDDIVFEESTENSYMIMMSIGVL